MNAYSSRSGHLSLWLGLTIAAAAWLAAATPPEQRPPSNPVARADCPHHGDSLAPLALAGTLTQVPEFHDCQRFIDTRGRRYEGLFGIFVSQYGERLWDSLRQLECMGVAGPLPPRNPDLQDSVAPPQLLPAGTCPDSQRVVIGLAFTEVLGFDRPYPPLGIAPGFNCLYLARTVRPFAVMIPVGNDRDCLRIRRLDGRLPSRSTLLDVRRQAVGSYAGTDYPAVARWDREEGRQPTQYAGVICGTAWCDVGQRNFSASAARGYPTGAGPTPTLQLTRTLDIKGWYDEQILATKDSAGRLVPSRVVGIAVPAERLDTYPRGTFDDTWVVVAHIALIGDDPPTLHRYRRLYGYSPSNFSSMANANRYLLCHGDRSSCLPAGATVIPCNNTADPWWGKVEPADGSPPKYRCEIFRGHGTIAPIPRGVVRWRWLATDEDLWKRCHSGCCQPT